MNMQKGYEVVSRAKDVEGQITLTSNRSNVVFLVHDSYRYTLWFGSHTRRKYTSFSERIVSRIGGQTMV